MKLKRISVKNIKSFKEKIVVDFDNNLNILIGANGGGKSNLLSIITIILNHYFYKQFEPKYEPNQEQKVTETVNDRASFANIKLVLEKYFGDISDSNINITLQSEITDYKNITLLTKYKDLIYERISKYNSIYKFDYPSDWPSIFSKNHKLEYCIDNYNLKIPAEGTPEFSFLYYLNNYHRLRWFTDEIDNIELYSPILFFPPSRTLTGNFTIEHQALKPVDFFNRQASISTTESKTSNVSLADIAVSHFGRKKRIYEKKAANTHEVIADDLYKNDEEVKLLSKYLSKIGYGWKVEEEETFLRYKFSLTKGNSKFDITKASSGEQEILNFLLGIFSLNVQGGLIFIDEPEIHLHPKWQLLLLEIIIELSNTKNNQFIISTHSPTFVNPNTYNYIIRVYKNTKNESQVVVLKDTEPFNLKDILHIINGTNNEKMFFSDVVILVEGITDRLVFEKIFDNLISKHNISKIVEVVEVKGKTNLEKFRLFLDKLQVPNFFIADLDYLNEVGTKEIKALFQINKNKIEKDVIKNKKSKDGDALCDALDEVIKTKDMNCLTVIWEHIKNIRRELIPNLSIKDKQSLLEFVNVKKSDNIYILIDGDIEKYFMDGFKSKSINNVISLLNDDNYAKWVTDSCSGFNKLNEIAKEIIKKL